MRERPDVGEKRIDLNVPQVAGAAVAAVVAAKLASYFGVYGTILGAGLVSVVATCGGSVFQHLFRRTGEQLRDAKAQEPEQPPRLGEFTEGTVYRARVRSWKRPLIAAALVFGVTMAGITTYELASGNSFSGGKGTTVADAVTGHDTGSSAGPGKSGADATTSPPSQTASDDPSPSSSASSGGGTASSATPTPSPTESNATPTPSESASASATTTPTPAASSRSGTADQDQADPEGQ
ncbi:hypothetical protein [Streptomyces justiciae]|uniref:hypothetical protein n=1 Tax=Streptomyces justiciae TaxID=2780140 RepID=UPI002118EE60|nr:hypothetical protein [Streptomyces justiciae]MCW8378164.1 hypothetical protein [Streptomyces justiciae]